MEQRRARMPAASPPAYRKRLMIKLSVMYPTTAGTHFDHAYYRDTHLPMIARKMGAALLYYAIEKGLSGVTPGSAPTYVAQCHLYGESVAALMAAMEAHAQEFTADVINFTDITSVLQISDVVVERSV